MAKRRNGLGGWLTRLRTWHQVLIFVGAAATLGSVATAAVGTFERQYGIGAAHFGFARAVEVADSFEDLKQWQLYSDSRRIKRAIFDLGTPQTERDRERFEDLNTQLATIQAEYDRIMKRKARP